MSIAKFFLLLVFLTCSLTVTSIFAHDWAGKPISSIQKAANGGDSDAQRQLGWMYSNGVEVLQSDEKAIFWYEKSAVQGNVRAQFFLGVRLASKGENKKALSWYLKAAKSGDSDAQFAVGIMYQDGRGTPKNDIKAYAWLSVAAANGDKHAARFRYSSEKVLTKEALLKAQELAEKYYNN